MSPRALLIEVRFPGGRYHGVGDWPPSPFRLFQALVAGAYGGRWRTEPTEQKDAAFIWLERLDPPLIAGPAKRPTRPTTYFVPNNDLDAKDGDPRRISEIRVGKNVRPLLFNPEEPIRYAWRLDGESQHAAHICSLAERLHTLGHGIDAAFALAEIVDWAEVERRLETCGGALATPKGLGNPEKDPQAPVRGSLDSLKARHRAMIERFRLSQEGRAVTTQFRQPPKPHFRAVSYDRPLPRFLFDLVPGDGAPGFRPVTQTRTVRLVEQVRDRMAGLLERGFDKLLVKHAVIGRNATEADKVARIRITPLPSIGSPHADRSIRRVLIEVPPDCPIPAREIERAAGAVHLGVDEHGEIKSEKEPQLVRATDEGMLRHYGISDDDKTFRLWRTVTPAALPERAKRRRMDPAHLRDRKAQKGAAERAEEELRAASGVAQALRHAGVAARPEAIRVQREPFARRGARAEDFAAGTRFPKERLWHVEIAFEEPVRGPLVIGDGRYLGLGLMAPEKLAWRDILVFQVPTGTNIEPADAPALVQAVRRALMALARDSKRNVPRLFSGHEPDGAPARGGTHDHIFIAAMDASGGDRIDSLIVAAPWACDRKARPGRGDRARFDRVTSRLAQVRAGRLGVIPLGPPAAPAEGGPLIGPARVWESHTPYRPARHARRGGDAEAAVMRDVIAECERRGLPRPEVEVLELDAGPRGGLAARLRLTFAVAVRGPLLLGRDSHRGGGHFIEC